ncbi:hypothetical protein [Tateyamaria sp. syn59]|uniref:hypothetical protein n=1 Tax=Tateyamaria sp. syn59 TaxID=2576942 RepID=UPI0011BF5729|nr:hypothetical protein [Tateyamaria sp. syn59]
MRDLSRLPGVARDDSRGDAMPTIRLIAPNEEPREAAFYDLEMSWVPVPGDMVVLSITGRGDLRYRVIDRTIYTNFSADHVQADEPLVYLEIQRLPATGIRETDEGAEEASSYHS